MSAVCCRVEVPSTGRSLVQSSPTKCSVCLRSLDTEDVLAHLVGGDVAVKSYDPLSSMTVAWHPGVLTAVLRAKTVTLYDTRVQLVQGHFVLQYIYCPVHTTEGEALFAT